MTTTKIIGPTRLYVGSLHFNVTEDDLKRIFAQYGELEFIDLHKDVETGRSKGFGFVQYVPLGYIMLTHYLRYRAPDAARKALQQANGLEIAGRPLKLGMVNETATASTHPQSSKKSLDLDDDGTLS
jgi:RNA-binding protein 39